MPLGPGYANPVGVGFAPPPGNATVLPTPPFHERNFSIAGVTQDAGGVAMGSVTVRLFNTATNAVEQTIVSDATTGAYAFVVDKTQRYYTVEYKAGSPDVFGTSANTLAGA